MRVKIQEVNSKRKARYGGGYKAFLNTVVAVALHHYLMEKGKHSPGVLLLDSPILSLKDETDTVSSVMRDNLFKYLVKTQEYGQIIIVENAIPKIDYGSAKLEEFTHDEKEGRYGLLIGYTE